MLMHPLDSSRKTGGDHVTCSAAALVALIVVSAYKSVFITSVAPGSSLPPGYVTDREWIDYMWRILIGCCVDLG